MLFQIPQRYRFSSKSQLNSYSSESSSSCFRYHKGTDFQANHNCNLQIFLLCRLFQIPQRYRFSSKSQHTTPSTKGTLCCFRYHKGTDFQANHNHIFVILIVVVLFQIPQRYRFSSKSQRMSVNFDQIMSCFRYHKGTDFQANHNPLEDEEERVSVVLDTTKVQIFKQITTTNSTSNLTFCCFRYHKGTDFQANHNSKNSSTFLSTLFQIPQRYRFSSKSQLLPSNSYRISSCFRYHKGTDFQANHNMMCISSTWATVVLDTTKVQIFKQITTSSMTHLCCTLLFQIPQRYRFSSKSQLVAKLLNQRKSCFRYHKGTDFQANHNSLSIYERIL